MTISPTERKERRRRTGLRHRRLLAWVAGLVLAAVLFAAGVALGEALHDNPKPGITQTSVRTVHP